MHVCLKQFDNAHHLHLPGYSMVIEEGPVTRNSSSQTDSSSKFVKLKCRFEVEFDFEKALLAFYNFTELYKIEVLYMYSKARHTR